MLIGRVVDSLKDEKTGNFSPTKRLKLSLQVEKVNSHKKLFFGQLKLVLNDFAEDGCIQTLTKELTKSPVSPAPLLHFSVKSTWISVDGVPVKPSLSSSKQSISPRNDNIDESRSLKSDAGTSGSEVEFTCDVCNLVTVYMVINFLLI